MKIFRHALWGLFFLLIFIPPLFAGVTILTPVSGKTSPYRQIVLVLKGPSGGIKIRSDGRTPSYSLVKKAPLKGEKGFVYHFRLTLKRGKNVFYLLPGEVRFTVSWNPAYSVAQPGRYPGIYLFHRKGADKVCLSCHKNLIELPKRGKACIPCHKKGAEFLKKGWAHEPAAVGDCFACHAKKPDAKGIRFTPFEGGSEALCFRCHLSNRRWKKMSYVHGPVGAGNCVFCHDPHGSTRKFHLRYDGKQGLCLVCHLEKAKRFSQKGFRFHAILTAKGCTVCHSPHASTHPYQLEAALVPLCVGCHPRFAGMKRGHPLTNHPVQGPRDPLHPQKRFSCVSCHNPHGSRFSSLLIAPRETQLCSRCHPY